MSFTNDTLGTLSFKQPRNGYRFSIDSVLLAYFASPLNGPVADLGAGCGVITRLLAGRGMKGPFVAVEINPRAVECCQENLGSINANVLLHDARLPHARIKPQSFSLLISNPPFALPERGRVSSNPDKADARHQLTFTLNDLWRAAGRLLKNKGRLALCLPPRLLDIAFAGMQAHGLYSKRLRLVHGRIGLPAKIALLEAVKGGGPELTVEAPLVIYQDADNRMTEELTTIYQSI